MERKRAPVAQLDRALASGARGRGFESRRVRHFFALKGKKTQSRKALLHCAKRDFTQKAQPFLHIFTKSASSPVYGLLRTAVLFCL